MFFRSSRPGSVLLLCFFLFFTANMAFPQIVYQPYASDGVYDLLDELANERVITINDAVRPWPRTYIAAKLEEALGKKAQLTARQLGEIEYYLQDYRLETRAEVAGLKPLNAFQDRDHLATGLYPLSFNYRDSLFALGLRPAAGLEMMANDQNGAVTAVAGLDGYGYYSRHLGIYASYRYHYESQAFSAPAYFTIRPGGDISTQTNGEQYRHELRWGMIYSWKWGGIGVVNDRPQWGNAYYGTNILSGHAPAFTQIRLQLKPAAWFEFNYLHGWLGSAVVDSSRSWWNGNTYEEVMRRKYIASNMFSIMPLEGLNISVGNSIIYSDMGPHAAYMVPFLFFRLADYEVSGMSDDASSNSQMFFSISSRNIRHLHLYFGMFIDELSIYRIGDADRHNFFSYKGGFRLSNWPLKNASLTMEYTYTLPAVYQHYISTTTFASEQYTLGHYMRDNSHDLFVSIQYKPVARLSSTLSYNFGQHGNDATYGGAIKADEIPMLAEISWQKSIFMLKADYKLLANASLYAALRYSKIEGFDVDDKPAAYYLEKFSPEMFRGEHLTAILGFRLGL